MSEHRKLRGTRFFDGERFHDDNPVLILTKDGCIADIVPAGNAGHDTENFDGILMPGLVNAHTHLELVHLKDRVPRNTGLIPFLEKVMSFRGQAIEEHERRIFEAMDGMYAEGCVLAGDICNTSATVRAKKEHPLATHSFIELAGINPDRAQEIFVKGKMLLGEFAGAVGSRNVSLTPHAPYSVSPQLMELIASEGAGPRSIHNQETAAEDEYYKKGIGDFTGFYERLSGSASPFAHPGHSSFAAWTDVLPANGNVIAVHNSFMNEADMKRTAETEALRDSIYFCICLRANEYIERKSPPVELLIKYGLNLCLGTDSLASNDSLSMADEIRACVNAFPQIPLEVWLKAATSGGAWALGREREFGYFRKDSAPGIVLLKEDLMQSERLDFPANRADFKR